MFAMVAMIILFTLGGLLVIAYFLFGQQRDYLLYLGIAFIGMGFSLPLSQAARAIALLISLVAFITAVVRSIQDTRQRMQQFMEEQKDRETAFAEYMSAVANKPDGDSDSPNAKPIP